MEQKKGETVAEDRASGRRMTPYFTSISPDDVWDWGMDAKGLAWAVVHSEGDGAPRSLRRPAPLRNPDRLDAGLMDALPPPDEGQGKHRVRSVRKRRAQARLGAVPLVPFLFEPTSPMTGSPPRTMCCP